jgi:hypothetical protein
MKQFLNNLVAFSAIGSIPTGIALAAHQESAWYLLITLVGIAGVCTLIQQEAARK